MTNKSPAFQFYPKDFIMDDKVAAMNLEQIGAYTKLLCYCWNNNGLTNDQEELKEMCGNPENWDKIWKKVGKCFYEKSDKLYNKRLDKEREKQEFWRKKSKEGGIKSGKTRQEKAKTKGGLNKTKGGSRKDEPKTNHSVSPVSSLQSSSLFSSPNNKKDTKVSFMSTSFKNNVISKWNELAQKHNLPAIKVIKPKSMRENHLRARMKEDGFDFDLLLDMIENSPFLLGKTKHCFFVFFDWIIEPSNYQKIIEGNYLDRQGYRKFSGIVEGIKELEEKYRKEGRK